ncbi:threonine/serine exporter family protein [Mycolicibacterium palauense]|uniref:threonine/serine ThrE exporter family protein n=1 Tax=Mycolicibacterium palauense TaxID=2034511 RepID=UPI000BFF00C4|nr:threonine/serine exporter family protein [Mycolicibacterium palauense]
MDDSANEHIRFLARLGAAMAAANYPVTLVRQMLQRASGSYGIRTDFLALPNHVQVVGTGRGTGAAVASANQGGDLRFDQTFPLARLVSDAMAARVSPAVGETTLDRILAMRRPYPAWVTVTGYGIFSGGLSLVMEPTALNFLTAAVLGLLVGLLRLLGERVPGLDPLTPVVSALMVSALCIAGARYLGLDHVGLRALIPPLAAFLPGVAITLSVVELTARDVVSGASRLIAGFMQMAQLAFGILIATQIPGLRDAELSSEAINKLGWWAPWVGVVVYAVGVMLFLAPPLSFLPWLLVVAYVAYTAQFVGDVVLGGYASGFVGALALTICALAISRRRHAPPAVSMILPGFWLLVPGSLGLIGVTEMFGAGGNSALPATLIAMISVAMGLQVGLVLWRLARPRR